MIKYSNLIIIDIKNCKEMNHFLKWGFNVIKYLKIFICVKIY